MNLPEPLPPSRLRRTCAPDSLPFEDTSELEPLVAAIGQPRALEALEFGVGMHRHDYGLYVLGPSGSCRHTWVRRHLEQRAAEQPVPFEWCYVNDFALPQKPRVLRLPPGRAIQLRSDIDRLLQDLQAAIPAAFESEDYRTRKNAIAAEFKERHEQAFEALRHRAEERGIVLLRTPDGLALAPTAKGEVLDSAQFEKLPQRERDRIDADLEELRKELQGLVQQAPRLLQEQRQRQRRLDREITGLAVRHLIETLERSYADLPDVVAHLQALQDDVLEHANQFLPRPELPLPQPLAGLGGGGDGADFRRYRVNVVVDHGQAKGAPVVYEDQPTLNRLVGRIEHVSQFGALVTDFSLIKAGALHRANGGYLIVDAHRLLGEPFAYHALQRALLSREIRIESLSDRLSLVSTVSLEPQTIPLDVKVVMIGERRLYYLLCALDPEFAELFKVPVDFEDAMPWTDDEAQRLARTLAAFVRDAGLRPLDRGAVARVIEHAARLAGDQEKVTAQLQRLLDAVRESDFWAGEAGRDRVTAADVQRSLDAATRRADRLRERMYEDIRRGIKRIETRDARVGQLNGLSVIDLGGFAFGVPTRITARARLGKGDVVDIEREVELGGPIHSKGVLILTGYLGQRFATELPLCLSASLVFEQSYGGVEGDSASSAELYALLSALAEIPLAQSLAVTGSVDQHGQVQAIGGVNEKIEGFYDVCAAGGLTGEQGVLIPASNAAHLMLRHDVVDAVAAGRFRIFPIETIDQGLEVLTGRPAGTPGDGGLFPAGTVNRAVQDRLAAMAERARAFGDTRERRAER